MKILIVNIILALASASFASELKVSHLRLGDFIKLPLTSHNIWIEDGKKVKAEITGSKLKVVGLQEGASLLSIGQSHYQIYVIHPKKQEALLKIQMALKKILGLKVEYTQGETVVIGELFRWQDWVALADQMKFSEIKYKMSAQISLPLRAKAQNFFDNLTFEAGLPKQRLVFSDSVHIRISQKNSYLQQYKKISAPFGIEVDEDPASLSIEQTVRIRITVAEVQRQWTQKMGLRWPDSYQAQLLPSTSWKFDSLDALASFFEQNGTGKILASPNLICRSGKDAEFLAGGEFPIKIINARMQDVIWKKYGILLRVKPTADSLGQMSLQIETEVSSLDPSKAVDGIPGLITHRVSSHFDLTSPQTIALSGLIKNEESRSTDGLPWLSGLPIFGRLFSSEDFRENRTELVIFVRPEIVDLQLPDASKPTHLLTDIGTYGN